MLEILDSAKHVVAMKLSGSFTADDVAKAYKASEEALSKNDKISFFAEIDSSTSLTWEGVYKDISEGLRRLGRLSRYYRAAVVTDKGWIGALARVEGLVFSSIDVRVFAPDEREKAFAWAGEAPAAESKLAEPSPSVHFLQTTSENVFAYEVKGRVREADIKAIVREMRPLLERSEKINVLGRVKDLGGFDLMAAVDDDLVRLNYKALSKVERYAVVGASNWMRNLLELVSPLFSVQVRVFEPSEEAAAWEWVGAQQALLAEKSA